MELAFGAIGAAVGSSVPGLAALAGGLGMTAGNLGWIAGSMVGGVFCPAPRDRETRPEPAEPEYAHVNS